MASYAEAYAAIRDAYRRALGRDPESSTVVDTWLGGDFSPESIQRATAGIEASEEAAAYRSRRGGGGETSNTMPVDQPPAATVTPPVQPTITQGFTPRHAFEGFAFDREQNTGKSAKDAFASLANQAPPPPIHDKQALGAWFRQYIEPGMNALGHRVSEVNGDTFRFSNWQGDFTVDYGRGAGAQGGALAWQVDPGTARMPDNPVYTPQAPTPQPPQTRTPIDPRVTPPPSAPSAPPPADVPMATLASRNDGPRFSGPFTDDAPMASLALQQQAEQEAMLDQLPMSELARARAARLRGLQWRPEAMI